MQILQSRILDLVDSLDLTYQQFGIADELQCFWSMLQSVLQRRNQSLILREIVGLMSKVLAEGGNLAASFILDHDAEASRPRVSAGTAVAMGDQIVGGWAVVRFQNVFETLLRGHPVSLIPPCSVRLLSEVEREP